MTTTAVFAEILVVGLQAQAWLTLVILAVFGTGWVDLGAVDAWATLVTVLVLATAYVIGILIDRIADTAVRWVAEAVRTLRGKPEPNTPRGVPFERMRMEILHESEGMAKFLDYQRSRQRVARGTVINAACAIPSALAFLARQTDATSSWLAVAVVAGLAVLAAAVFANEKIYRAYTRNLTAAYLIIRA